MGSTPRRTGGLRPSKCSWPVMLLLLLPSLLLIAGSTAADSREDLPLALSSIPTLSEDQEHVFSASLEGAGQVDVQLLKFTWEFDDPWADDLNPTNISGHGLDTVNHRYTRAGTYAVSVMAEDDGGRKGLATGTATVINLAPVPDFYVHRQSTFEDEEIELDASKSTDTPTDLSEGLEYSWVLPDGTETGFTEDPVVTLKLTSSGEYMVELRVRDSDGDVGVLERGVWVDNQPPLADAGAPERAFEDAAIQFDASMSTDTVSDRDGLGYTWVFDDGTTLHGKTVTHAFETSGTHEAKLVVTDDDGMYGVDIARVEVQNVRPSADAGADQEVEAGAVTLDGSGSFDTISDKATLRYRWDFGDGHTAEGRVVEHVYRDAGTYRAWLTVTDDDGASDDDAVLVTVNDAAPIAFAGPDLVVGEDEVVEFDASGSSDRDGRIMDYRWELEDGTVLEGVSAQHTFSSAGIYVVKLVVRDDRGTEVSDTVKVMVENVPPVPRIVGPAIALQDTDLTFDGSSSLDTPSDMPTLKYAWDFGGGDDAVGAVAAHRFTEPGDHEISLTVVDDDGNSATAKALVMIVDPAVLAMEGLLDVDVELTPSKVKPGESAYLVGYVKFNHPTAGPMADLLVANRAEVTVTMVGTGQVWELEPDKNGKFTIEIVAPEKTGNYEISVQVALNPLNVIKEETLKVQAATEGAPVAGIAVQFAAGTAIMCAVGAGAYIGGTDIGKFKFFTLLIPLYSRVRKEKVLDHFERGRIYEHIRKNPGDHYTSIKRTLGLKNGSLAYHLRVLETNEYVFARDDGFYKRFYPWGMKVKDGKHKSVQELIIELIMERPEITQKKIAEGLGIDRSTVNYHVKILLAMGVIRTEKRGKVKVYFYEGVSDPLPYSG